MFKQGDKVYTPEGYYGTVQLFNNPLLEATHVSVVLGDGSMQLYLFNNPLLEATHVSVVLGDGSMQLYAITKLKLIPSILE